MWISLGFIWCVHGLVTGPSRDGRHALGTSALSAEVEHGLRR
jgi:hypothetical protein